LAISTYKVFLMHKEAGVGGTYKKLIDIKEFPDLGGDPEMIETTTLSDKMQTFIAGIQSMDAMPFTANYTLAEYKELQKLNGKTEEYAVWFGGTGEGDTLVPDGSDGKFKFKGQLTCYPTGGGTNEVINLNISIAPSTPIELDET
jgi:hypothetical protein